MVGPPLGQNEADLPDIAESEVPLTKNVPSERGRQIDDMAPPPPLQAAVADGAAPGRRGVRWYEGRLGGVDNFREVVGLFGGGGQARLALLVAGHGIAPRNGSVGTRSITERHGSQIDIYDLIDDILRLGDFIVCRSFQSKNHY